MTRRVSLEDPGLDRVLGGLPLVDRGTGVGNSIVLIRGPAGAGKSLLAAKIASSLARDCNGAAIWACVELLTTEATAQLAQLEGHVAVFRDVLRTSVPAPPLPAILAEQLDIESAGSSSIAELCSELVEQFEERQISPAVIVVDSIATGYKLSESESRIAADALCKLAHAKGLSLVLVEESDLQSQSIWTFAVDVVVEVDRRRRARPEGSSLARECVIAKNRFGFASVGPHQLDLSAKGARVFPRPGSYAAVSLAPPDDPTTRAVLRAQWTGAYARVPNLAGRLCSVLGPDEDVGMRVARLIAESVAHSRPNSSLLAVDLASTTARIERAALVHADYTADFHAIGIGDPTRSPHSLLAALEQVRAEHRHSIVFISDLSALDRFAAADEQRHAIAIWCEALRSDGRTVIATETAMLDEIVVFSRMAPRTIRSPAQSPSLIHNMADLRFEHRVQGGERKYTHSLFEPASGNAWQFNVSE